MSKETAKVGQTVFLPSLRQNGTIVAVNGGDVTVQVGILKTNVPAKNCLLVKGKTKVSEDLRPKTQGMPMICWSHVLLLPDRNWMFVV